MRNKTLAAEETGVRSRLLEYGNEVSEAAADGKPSRAERGSGGPRHPGAASAAEAASTRARVLESIAPAKDVDGFHEANLGALMAGRPGVVPCTPLGCMRLIEHAGVPIAGRHAVVVGRSNIVGKPLARLLLQKDATVTICHSKSADLAGICRSADILVAAVGRAKLVTADMVKPGPASSTSASTDCPTASSPATSISTRSRGRGLDHPGARRRRPDDDRDAAGKLQLQ